MSPDQLTTHKHGVIICPVCMLHAQISLNFGKVLSESFVTTRTDAQKVVERYYRQEQIDRATYEDLTLEVSTDPDLHDNASVMDAVIGDLSVARIIQNCHPKHDYPEISSIRLRPPLVAYN